MLESTSWYRDKLTNVEDTMECDKSSHKVKLFKDKSKSMKGKSHRETRVKPIDVDGKPKLMGVLFAPYTEMSELAKRWRSRLETFEKVGDLKLKIVERTGDKLTDLLHKSNICEDMYCERQSEVQRVA